MNSQIPKSSAASDWYVRGAAIYLLMTVAFVICRCIEQRLSGSFARWASDLVYIAASIECIVLPQDSVVVRFVKWVGGVQ